MKKKIISLREIKDAYEPIYGYTLGIGIISLLIAGLLFLNLWKKGIIII